MTPIEMIQQAYTQVADGMKRIDLENKDGVKVTAYQMGGNVLRIDIKEPPKPEY
jgi:hypothetical protein